MVLRACSTAIQPQICSRLPIVAERRKADGTRSMCHRSTGGPSFTVESIHMKSVSRFALGLAIASISLTASTGLWAADEAKPEKQAKEKKGKKGKEEAKPQGQFSNEFKAAFLPANDAFDKAKDYAKAAQLLPAVIAVAKSDDEKFQAGRLALLVGQQNKDIAMQKQGVDLALSSATLQPDLKGIFTYQRAIMAINDGNFAAAQPDLLAAYNLGYRKSNIEFNLGNTYQQMKNNAEALNWYQKAVEAAKAANSVPDRAIFVRGITIAGNMKDPGKTAYWGKEMIRAYPDAKSYRDAVVFFDSVAALDTQESLDLFRLARLNKGLIAENDYRMFVEASSALYPAETISVIKEGVEAKAINADNTFFKPQLTTAIAKESELRGGWDADEKSALAATKGIQAALMGDSMLSFGEYARAQKLYEAALQKGNLVDVGNTDQTERARTRLAIAKVMQGNYAGAKADFTAVTGANRKAIAEFWLLYLAQKGA
jgi:tetratricopeptide (TPR) repeat protein